jgi:hypothetical protein
MLRYGRDPQSFSTRRAASQVMRSMSRDDTAVPEALVTGLDRADFTTHQARRALTRLGFPAARAASSREHYASADRATGALGPASGRATTRPTTLVEALRPFIGLWVAVRGDEVLVAAPSPKDVVAWLAQHGQRAQSMFRVPDSEQAITGAAPQ